MFVCATVCGAQVAAGPAADQLVADQLRRLLEAAPVPLELQAGGESVLARQALPSFYERRIYEPAWVGNAAAIASAHQLLAVIGGIGREGLRPKDYHQARLGFLLEEAERESATPGALAELDLLSTDAFLMLGAHLVSGRVDPIDFDHEWFAVRREVDLLQVLDGALERGDIRASLDSLLPQHRGYLLLREAGERLENLVADGGWPTITPGPTLKLDDVGPRVVELRARLGVTEVAETDSAVEPDRFDAALETLVRSFQSRHGLDADGVVGQKTLAALNVSAAARLEQIHLNLERWRWLPQNLGERYVLVNLPAFDLQVVEGETTLLEMRVAVGRRYRRTPVFSDVIRYLVFNPYWEIPTSIAVNDKVPEIRKDPGYFDRQGVRVFSGWGAEQQAIDPASVDWDAVGRGSFPYRLRQDPGPLNALGRVKFMFPNRFNIYLHDTPGREVFSRAERDVSSGCIRVARPLELAELLLRDNNDWQSGASREILADYRERTIRLQTPWPVHLLHWSAWVDDRGEVQFRADLYDRDDKLARALADSR